MTLFHYEISIFFINFQNSILLCFLNNDLISFYLNELYTYVTTFLQDSLN